MNKKTQKQALPKQPKSKINDVDNPVGRTYQYDCICCRANLESSRCTRCHIDSDPGGSDQQIVLG